MEVSLSTSSVSSLVSNIWLGNDYSLDDEGIFYLLKGRLLAESGLVLLLIKVREYALIRINVIKMKIE